MFLFFLARTCTWLNQLLMSIDRLVHMKMVVMARDSTINEYIHMMIIETTWQCHRNMASSTQPLVERVSYCLLYPCWLTWVQLIIVFAFYIVPFWLVGIEQGSATVPIASHCCIILNIRVKFVVMAVTVLFLSSWYILAASLLHQLLPIYQKTTNIMYINVFIPTNCCSEDFTVVEIIVATATLFLPNDNNPYFYIN